MISASEEDKEKIRGESEKVFSSSCCHAIQHHRTSKTRLARASEQSKQNANKASQTMNYQGIDA